MSEENALIPVEQKQIIFYDDELTAVIVEEERGRVVYVPVRLLCERLGLDWSAQYRRLNRDPVLSGLLMSVAVTATDISSDDRRPRTCMMVCLPLDYLNGYLFGISADRVRRELREKVILYQKECYKTLAAAFLSPSLNPAPTTEQATLMHIREMGLAIAQMAEQQMALTTRLDKAAIIVGEHGRRLTTLEQQLAPRQAITDEQAANIAEKVKALAMQLTTQNSSKNHFQSIFAELYRRFRVSSYKVIRQSQYHL
ncbi:MAG: ORF6C domain-containing protein [Anaerolineae bacterium]|nr:ORF6C domain-containing protein [Anaerolineae bacterium]